MLYQYLGELYYANKLSSAVIINSRNIFKTLNNLQSFIKETMLNTNISLDSHPDFYKIEKLEDARDITIDQIRNIQKLLYKKSAFDGPKIVIIYQADLMNLNAANSMLKVLEDTPHNSYIFLLTSKSSRLISTIKSRCVILQDLNASDKGYKYSYDEFIKLVNNNDINQELEIIKKLKNKDRELWSEIAAHSVVFISGQILKEHSEQVIGKYDYISKLIKNTIENDLDLSASFIILLDELRK